MKHRPGEVREKCSRFLLDFQKNCAHKNWTKDRQSERTKQRYTIFSVFGLTRAPTGVLLTLSNALSSLCYISSQFEPTTPAKTSTAFSNKAHRSIWGGSALWSAFRFVIFTYFPPHQERVVFTIPGMNPTKDGGFGHRRPSYDVAIDVDVDVDVDVASKDSAGAPHS